MDLSSHLVTIVKTLMHLGHMGETSDKVCTHADMGSKVLKHRLYAKSKYNLAKLDDGLDKSPTVKISKIGKK